MNTYACFIFLLAIGLSSQMSEFDIDFQNMVKTVKLKDNRTLLNCSEKCNEIEETACKCRNFTCSVGTPFFDCIQQSLDKLNFGNTVNFIARLKALPNVKLEDKRLLTDQKLSPKMSPKSFLNYIVELHQISNARASG